MRSRYTSKVLTCLFLLALCSTLSLEVVGNLASSSYSGTFNYRFVVDEDGSAEVAITYSSNSAQGSTWVLVPKFLEWVNYTLQGEITNWSLNETEEIAGTSYYFYKAYYFSFNSDGSKFEMVIRFNFTASAMIIEPDGIFLSPQIGFEKNNALKAEVIFPSGFNIRSGEVIAFGSYSYSSTPTNSNYVQFDNVPENLIRLQIGFRVPGKTADYLTIEEGIFTFQTVQRYANYAEEVLNLYNITYDDLVNLFNVTLESTKVQFFLPDFNSLFSIGGYVPFTGENLGDIYINLFFLRFAEGYVEVTALHELVHHFLWKAGFSPETLLWFHEGMAQYVSIEVALRLGYEGSSMMKDELEEGIQGIIPTLGNNLGFLQRWTPSVQPQDMGILYTAAYYVVSRLADLYGGLEYYANFFKLINGAEVEDNTLLGYYLSLAANASVTATLKSWGFEIIDLYVYSDLMREAERATSMVDPIFQPYKFIAELLYQIALRSAEKNNAGITNFLLMATIFTAKMAPLLTLITISGIVFASILLILKKKGTFSD